MNVDVVTMPPGSMFQLSMHLCVENVTWGTSARSVMTMNNNHPSIIWPQLAGNYQPFITPSPAMIAIHLSRLSAAPQLTVEVVMMIGNWVSSITLSPVSRYLRTMRNSTVMPVMKSAISPRLHPARCVTMRLSVGRRWRRGIWSSLLIIIEHNVL